MILQYNMNMCIKVRRTTGDQLYMTLLSYGELLPDDGMVDEAMQILSDTLW